MIRLGPLAALLFALLGASPALADNTEGVGGVSTLQQEEEAPEIGPYPGEEEPDCE